MASVFQQYPIISFLSVSGREQGGKGLSWTLTTRQGWGTLIHSCHQKCPNFLIKSCISLLNRETSAVLRAVLVNRGLCLPS